MELKDSNKVQKEINLKEGSILINDNVGTLSMFVLHQGSVGVFLPECEGTKSDQQILGKIPERSYFGFESYLSKKNPLPVIKCTQDSIISIYPFSDVAKLAYVSRTPFLQLLKSMILNLPSYVKTNNRIVDIVNSLRIYNYRFANVISQLGVSIIDTSLEDYVGRENEEVLLEDPSNFLKKDYDVDIKYRHFVLRDTDLIEMLLSAKNTNEIDILIKKNPTIGKKIFDTLCDEFGNLYMMLHRNVENLAKEMNSLVLDKKSAFDLIKTNAYIFDKNLIRDFFPTIFGFFTQNYFDNPLIISLFDRDLIERRLEVTYDEEKTGIPDHTADIADTGDPAARELSPMNFGEKEGDMPKDVKAFMQNKGQFSEDQEYRKLVRKTNDFFIDKYIDFFKKIVDNPETEDWIKQSIRTGIISRDTISKKALVKIVKFNDKEKFEDYKFYDLYEWLTRIYSEQEEPSNNEMGLSYRKFTLHEQRSWSQKKKEAHAAKSEKELKVERFKFEMQNMINTVYKIVNESPLTAIFPLCERSFEAGRDGTFLTRKFIRNAYEEVRACDFSVFYRERLFQTSKTKKAVFQKEILPMTIILPIVGHRVVMWQDMVENKKETPARFIVPRIFVGDFKKALLKALGGFRWEICKSMKGISWTDPVYGGLTGLYTDYISFYKKNSQLTLEAKDKLKEMIRNSRNDYKKLFSMQYVEWMESESNGLIRLNPYERELFMKFAPFSKEYREKLEKLPAFSRAMQRHKNIWSKMLTTNTNVFRKTMDDNERYPKEIEKYLKFLQF